MINFFETEKFLLVWKPHNLPTSFGKRESFLEQIDSFLKQKIDLNVKKFNGIAEEKLKQQFLQEYGLLNRLDTPTAGYLYFAKDFKTYFSFKVQQNKGNIYKLYVADVSGDYRKFGKNIIAYPLMHHKHLKEKMVVIKKSKLITKGRGKLLFRETFVDFLYFDKDNNISTLMVYITKGVRHQIRAHLASIGYPIVGDNIYSKNPQDKFLHLWSIGFEANL